MIFKILNEKLDAYFNEEEIEPSQEQQEEQEEVLADAEPEVVELVQDVTDEYGDLTIPQFIDALIKEEGKEEDLEESLNEEVTPKQITKIAKKVASKTKNGFTIHQYPVEKVGGSVIYEDLTFRPEYEYVEGVVEAGTLKTNINDRINFVNDDLAVRFPITFKPNNRSRQDSVDRNSFYFTMREPYCFKSYTSGKSLAGDLRRLWTEYTKDNIFFKHTGKCMNPYFGESVEMFVDSEQEVVEDIISCVEEYFALADAQKWGEKHKQEHASKYQAEVDEIEALKQARAQARANKKAATTTVKRALSKTSVINQIKALENPTEEQLAKILAAIQ